MLQHYIIYLLNMLLLMIKRIVLGIILFHLQYNNTIQIRSILFRDVFSLQLPPLFISLDSDTNFIMSVLPIYFIYCFCQSSLLFTIYEELTSNKLSGKDAVPFSLKPSERCNHKEPDTYNNVR